MRLLPLLLILMLSAFARGAGEVRLESAATDALLQDAVAERLACRLTVRVRDKQGKPDASARIRVRATAAPAFRLGASVNPGLWQKEGANSAYRRTFGAYFRTAVIEEGLRWNQWEGPLAGISTGTVSACVSELRGLGVPVLGNALVSPGWARRNPAGLDTLDPGALQARIVRHCHRLAGLFADRITEWDVVNQPRVDRDFETRLGAAAPAEWFLAAASAAPDARLGFAEFGLLDAPAAAVEETIARVEAWRRAGAVIPVLRLQSTFFARLPDLARVRGNLDRLAGANLRLEISELCLAAGTATERAEALRHLLALLAQHPAVDAVHVTNWWPGDTPWSAEAALFAPDGNPTAAGAALENLRRALPADTQVHVDARGNWTGPAPRGRVEIEITTANGTERREVILSTEYQTEEFGAPAPPPVSVFRLRAEEQWLLENKVPQGPINLDKAPPAPR